MVKTSLAVCLMLLVALSAVYGRTQGGNMRDRMFLTRPKMGKDVERYAYKHMLGFVNELESKCLATAEFQNLFAKLREYIEFCFKSASPRSIDFPVEMSRKSEQVIMAMSALSGTKDQTSMKYWWMILGLVSMEKRVIEMRKIYPKDLTLTENQEDRIFWETTTWVLQILLFVKEASEMKGKQLDTTSFGLALLDYDFDHYKRYVNGLKTPFSLPLYLKNFPKRRKDFEDFAYKGMSDFQSDLEDKCPRSPEFKEFFINLQSYMVGFKTLSPDSYSSQTELGMIDKAKLLFVSMAALNGTKGGTLDSWKVVDGLFSVGQALVEMKKNGSKDITSEEMRELSWSIVKWARGISLFVKTASEKKGVSVDLSSFDKYYDSHVLVPAKGTFANNNSNSTKPN